MPGIMAIGTFYFLYRALGPGNGMVSKNENHGAKVAE
jgi:hypothetical protein